MQTVPYGMDLLLSCPWALELGSPFAESWIPCETGISKRPLVGETWDLRQLSQLAHGPPPASCALVLPCTS